MGFIYRQRVVLLNHQLHPIVNPLRMGENGIAMMGGIPMEELVGNRPLGDYGIHNPPRALANRALTILRMYNNDGIEPATLRDTYNSLERASGISREELQMDVHGLHMAFYGLINSMSNIEGNRRTVARSLLFFTQFISESLRITDVQEWMGEHFLRGGKRLSRYILSQEHG